MQVVLMHNSCFLERCVEDWLVGGSLLRRGVAHQLDSRSVDRSKSQMSNLAVSLPFNTILGTENAVFDLEESLNSSVDSLAGDSVANSNKQGDYEKEGDCFEAETLSVVTEVARPSSVTVK